MVGRNVGAKPPQIVFFETMEFKDPTMVLKDLLLLFHAFFDVHLFTLHTIVTQWFHIIDAIFMHHPTASNTLLFICLLNRVITIAALRSLFHVLLLDTFQVADHRAIDLEAF